MTKIFVFPGQGSQHKGMGADLFQRFPEITAAADQVLGYSIERLCLEDPDEQLTQTAYTQPALYTVNALSYLNRTQDGSKPDFLAGHSLGEYNALFAAGTFDFATGLKLVQKRGKLMHQATGGGMAAIMGLGADKIRDILQRSGFETIDVANLNTPEQTVISGLERDVRALQAVFEEAGAGLFVPLKVSGAFHSRYMQPARDQFEVFLRDFKLSFPQVPVISNVSATPYQAGEVKDNLCRQITHPVRWTDTILYLLGQTDPQFEEIGPGKVLNRLIQKIRKS
ncbi:MAG: ACP S-malonyltransferase [Acidobacteriota bacterium]